MFNKGKINDILKIVGIPVLVASLCCLTPVIIVIFGIGTVTLASAFSDTLYGQYKWVFRALGIILLAISVVFYIRRKQGICTFDEAKKRRNEIINIVVLAFIIGVAAYIVFLYGVVEYIGKALTIWK